MESDAFDEAVPLLEEVLSDPRYPHQGEALADLADVRLRAGDFEQAQSDAERALDLGAVAPACLVLGALAFEYYHLDEAVRWYEQALAASQVGDPVWVAAHQMLADVHAQRGDGAADRVLRHALAALEHTDGGQRVAAAARGPRRPRPRAAGRPRPRPELMARRDSRRAEGLSDGGPAAGRGARAAARTAAGAAPGLAVRRCDHVGAAARAPGAGALWLELAPPAPRLTLAERRGRTRA
jgi:tetratricopeptide (TPR) repeat protein